MVKACEDGLGIAYLPKGYFSTALAQNKVTPILNSFWNTTSSSWIVYQNRRFLPMRARLAIDFLLQHFSGWSE